MLAVNVTKLLRETPDGPDAALRVCSETTWPISHSALERSGDELMAVDGDRIAGVFTVRDAVRDERTNEVRLVLEPAPHWEWVIGQQAPVNMRPKTVRVVAAVFVDQLRERQPSLADAKQGWRLQVAPDGRSATVYGPGVRLVVTGLGAGAAELALKEE